MCDTYPQCSLVPKSIDDDTLKQVAAFRQGGRFPVLSYYHKDNGVSRGHELNIYNYKVALWCVPRIASLPLPRYI